MISKEDNFENKIDWLKKKFDLLFQCISDMTMIEKPLNDEEWFKMFNEIKQKTNEHEYDFKDNGITEKIYFDCALSTLFYIEDVDKSKVNMKEDGIFQGLEPFSMEQIDWIKDLVHNMFDMVKKTEYFPIEERSLTSKLETLDQYKKLSGHDNYVCDLCNAFEQYFTNRQKLALKSELYKKEGSRGSPISQERIKR